MSPPERRLSSLWRLCAGPAIWFAHLSILYGAESLTCTLAASRAHATIWIAAAVTVAALGALSLLVAPQIRALAVGGASDDKAGTFFPVVTLTLAFMATCGMLWTALPVAVLPSC